MWDTHASYSSFQDVVLFLSYTQKVTYLFIFDKKSDFKKIDDFTLKNKNNFSNI